MIDHEYIVPKETSKKSEPNDDDPLATPKLIMIVGGTGSGKSTTLANIMMALEEKHDFSEAMFVTSNNRDKLLESVEMPITSSPGDLSDFMLKVRQAKDDEKSILILDDIQGSTDFNVMLGRSEFTNFILSHRHFGGGCWILVTAQTLKGSFSPQFRKNVSLWFNYYPRDEDELKEIQKVSGERIKMKKALALAKLEGKHAFVFTNKINPENIRYFMGFKRELVDL